MGLDETFTFFIEIGNLYNSRLLKTRVTPYFCMHLMQLIMVCKYGAYLLTNYQNAFDMQYAVVSGILLELTFSSLNMLLLIFHFNWH